MPEGLRDGRGRQGGEKQRRQGCERHESSRPCVSQTRNTNMKLLCLPFWPCNILSGGMVTPVSCVDGTHWHKHTCAWACTIAAPTNKHSHKQWINSYVSLKYELEANYQTSFPSSHSTSSCSLLPPPWVRQRNKRSERDLHPLTCGSLLYRLLLLPPHFLDISDHNVCVLPLSLCGLNPYQNYSWIICCVMCAVLNKSPSLSASIWKRLNKEVNSAVSSRGVDSNQSFLRLN